MVSKFQLPSSNGSGFMMFGRLGEKGRVNQLFYDKVFCTTAKATPDLLINLYRHKSIQVQF